ncbi:DinB family protein [Paenibacillus aurantius]|uniref:DinB family protein n=2 Tax=Paenibacillus aurantius TaxID=2918900 RepID=A0AA96RDB3_9BACL|nr:DinB family protein [Paenibacillus aurantius]WNQ09627.1 DinB family protein [Paenibacillus aurantius]
MVRDEWFELSEQISRDELMRKRIGGVGGILSTLIHIVDVENSWIRGIQGKPDIQLQFDKYNSIQQIRNLSNSLRTEIRPFLETWKNDFEHDIVTIPWTEGLYTKGEILRHVIAHEIHHIGQLSVWVRDIGLQPVSANYIGRGLL